MGSRGSKSPAKAKNFLREGHEHVDVYGQLYEVARETEKAVLIADYRDNIERGMDYQRARSTGGHIDTTALGTLQGQWLPKSQVSLDDKGNLIGVAPWLAKKYGVVTNEAGERQQKWENEQHQKYEKTIERAKALGIKGVRKGMKYSTIERMAKQQGVEFKAK